MGGEHSQILDSTPPVAPATPWLIRISEVFGEYTEEILTSLDASMVKRLGNEFVLVQARQPAAISSSPAADFVRWNLPVEHAWPCSPEKMTGFVEKAAQAIHRKFGARPLQAILAGPLEVGATNRYYKSLASNLRGRTLQLFPEKTGAIKDAEAQEPEQPTLFCMVGKEGLFAGIQSPLACNGLHPGGTKYIRSSPDTISRAGAKVAEALHYLRMYRPVPAEGSRWLELGASPGGMTAELLARQYAVTAIDRAPLDKRLDHRPGLNFLQMDTAEFSPAAGLPFGVILSDTNGDPADSMREICRLSRHLKPGGLVIFTLKMAGAEDLPGMQRLVHEATATAAAAGLTMLAKTHLTYNRRELTLFFGASRQAA